MGRAPERVHPICGSADPPLPGVLKRPATPPARPPRHVCLVLLTGLGDVVHGLPVANALKRAWPDARISWVVEPMPAGILAPHPAIDQVVVYEKGEGLRGVRDLRRRLKDERVDLTLNLMPYFKSVWGTLFSGAPERWTFGPDRARDGVWLTGNRWLPARERSHTQDMFLEFVEALGVDPHPLEWGLVITPEERARQQRFVRELDGRPAVALVTASANRLKDWPVERYVSVVDAIEHDLGARAVLVGGPGEREARAADFLARRSVRPPLSMLGTDVRRLIWTLEASAAVVGPDTGPLHVARAVGTPVVGLFGHTNPWRVGPYRAYRDLWIDRYTEPGEAPDPSNATPKHDRLEQISAAEVIEKVAAALERAGGVEPGSGLAPSGPEA